MLLQRKPCVPTEEAKGATCGQPMFDESMAALTDEGIEQGLLVFYGKRLHVVGWLKRVQLVGSWLGHLQPANVSCDL